jgi:hypothetical protein
VITLKALIRNPTFKLMKTRPLAILFTLLVATIPVYAQSVSAPASAADYEELPELKASEILRPDMLQGPNHKVREEVSTYSGANRFSIDSNFGVFEAEGNEMLIRRVSEIDAIARLKEVSRTDQYKSALLKAAKSPVAAAKSIVTDPVGTVASVPKGLMKFMGRARESVKGIGKKDDSSAAEGSKAQQLIGFSDTKRKVAISLGVDPYSTNAVLQKELDGISWASFAGGLTFQVATMPIGGPVLTVTGVTSTFQEVLRDKSPTDLKIMNRKILLGMGASAADAEAFLNNGAFSPLEQTAFVLNLKSLDGVANRGAFVRLAAKTSSDEADAIFCVETAELMGNLHEGEKPLARIAFIGDFPICVAKDGTVVVALQWDYAAWTPLADRFARDVKAEAKGKPCIVALSGMVSPRLRQELESRGFRVQDRLAAGPLK